MNSSIAIKARKTYLSSLKDPQVSSELLFDLLAQAEMQTSELLVEFQPATDKHSLDPDPISWSAEYLSCHLLLTEHNFSRKRIEHLIQVRDHLRKQGVKGFVPVKNLTASTQKKEATRVTPSYMPSSNLHKFVKEGDLLTIRTALRIELNNNSLTSDNLRAALAWTKAKVPGLFETYQEKAFARGMESSQKSWTSKYYDNQVVFLKTNFCEERLLHLIEVRDWLRRQGVEGFTALPPKPGSNANSGNAARQQSSQSQRTGTSQSSPELNPVFKAALLIGGAVAALVVLLAALVK